MATEVRRNDERSQYELLVDGDVIGFAAFRERDDLTVFPHTVIDPQHRGRGNGDTLVQGALDDVRRRGRRIVATCWFVQEFLHLNPEYADLVADR